MFADVPVGRSSLQRHETQRLIGLNLGNNLSNEISSAPTQENDMFSHGSEEYMSGEDFSP